MSTAARRLIVLFALVGLVSSGLSTYVHYRLVVEPGYLSFCDISATVNCTEVYLRRFGSVQGVPVGLGRVMWFGLALALGLLGGRGAPETRENLPAYLLVMSTTFLGTVFAPLTLAGLLAGLGAVLLVAAGVVVLFVIVFALEPRRAVLALAIACAMNLAVDTLLLSIWHS